MAGLLSDALSNGVESLVNDLERGLRALVRAPLYTVTAVVTLAFASGAVVAVLSLAYGFLYRPLPVARASELVMLTATRDHGAERGLVSWPDYVALKASVRSLRDLAAHYSSAPLQVQAGERSREANGAVVSANFFPVLGLRPALGRFFLPDEDRVPDRDRVAVLSYEAWQSWFAGASTALGARVRVNGAEFSVVGVAPEGFQGLSSTPNDIYLPTMMLRTGYRWCGDALSADCTVLSMIGRLAPGSTLARAEAEVPTLIPRRWLPARAGENSGLAVRPARGAEHDPSEDRLLGLLLLVAIVLLGVATANLAGLASVRGRRRRQETAVRLALGASRAGICRQWLSESVWIGLAGGLLGLLVAGGLTRFLQLAFYSADVEGYRLRFDFSLTPGIALLALVVSLGAGLAMGWLPSLQALRLGAAEALKRGGGAAPRGRSWGTWLIALQTAAAVALLFLAVLTLRSAAEARAGMGTAWRQVALLRLRPRLVDYPAAKAGALMRAAVARLQSLPGVESVSLSEGGVFGGDSVRVAGGGSGTALAARRQTVGESFFSTLGVPMLRGREIEARDASSAVVVINETLARRLWAEQDALGSSVTLDGVTREVVGVAQDLGAAVRGEDAQPAVFVPFWQASDASDVRLAIRVAGDPEAALPALVRALSELDRAVPITETMTLAQQLDGRYRPARLAAAFLSYGGILAMALSLIGLYAALASAAALRTKETALRMAIGARPGQVTWEITRDGLRALWFGLIPGLALGQGGVRLARHLLVGPPADLVALLAVAVGALAAGTLACWFPARRATRIDPAAVLRGE